MGRAMAAVILSALVAAGARAQPQVQPAGSQEALRSAFDLLRADAKRELKPGATSMLQFQRMTEKLRAAIAVGQISGVAAEQELQDLRKDLAKAYFIQAIDSRNRRAYPEAYQDLVRARAAYPLDVLPREFGDLEKQAKKLYEEAYVIKSTDPEEAVRKLNIAVRIVPEDQVYWRKAMKLRASILKEPEPLFPSMEAPLPPPAPVPPAPASGGSQPADPSDPNQVGIKAFKEGRFQEAADHFEEALRKNPRHCSALINLGSTFGKLGHRDKQRKTYRKFVTRCPNDSKAPIVKQILSESGEW